MGFTWWAGAQSSTNLSRQVLRTDTFPPAARQRPIGLRNPAESLGLAIALPLRNTPALTNLLQGLYDPASTNFHRFLTPEEFTERFGPTTQDYEALKSFAQKHQLTVTGTHPNRTLLNVRGSVARVQRAFNITLRNYRHPTESRTFFAPDAAPQVDSAVPMLEICGLDDFTRPQPLFKVHDVASRQDIATPDAGSGPFGTFMGNDFRAAYVPGITLKGNGQKVGLFQLDGYYPNDPVQYAIQTGLTNSIALTTLSNILVGDFDGSPGVNNVEVALDIEMAMAMAPEAQILVYMATNYATGAIDALNRMATDNLAKQLSASWSFPTGPATAQVFLQMACQGQAFFNSSGDRGAYVGEVTGPKDIPYITVVGGTTLTTVAPGGARTSEVVWNTGTGTGSGGGFSTTWPIPSWQQNISMTNNHGSSTMRNLPDVAMVANNVFAIAGNGAGFYLQGTSVAAPLWAAFTALVNQRAEALGRPPVGCISPALYELGKSSAYTNLFNDITIGDNTTPTSPTNFPAVAGFDLCTGWGSPQPALIDALANIVFVPDPGWTLTVFAPNETWSSVACAADFSVMVAAGSSQPYVSTTAGRFWQRRPGYVQSVCCSSDGTKMAGTHYEVPIVTSTNTGQTWLNTSTEADFWGKVATSGNGVMLAAGSSSQGVLFISTNSGNTWNPSSVPGGILASPAWSADGKVLVATPRGIGFYVSTNAGRTCYPATLPGLDCIVATISGDAARIVAAGIPGVLVSTDLGTSWQNTTAPAVTYTAMATSYDGYRLFAASELGVLLSDDGGLNWTNIGPANFGCNGLACSADGTRVVAVGFGSIYTGLFPRQGPTGQVVPANQLALLGSNAVITATGIGPAPFSYQWYFQGAKLVGATNSTLELTNLQYSQAGNYSVVLSNRFGTNLSGNAGLSIWPPAPTIIAQPEDRIVALGQIGSFLVTATGAPPLTYQWQCNATNLLHATNSQLLLPNAAASQAGVYRVMISNAVGTVTSSDAWLTVIPPPTCLESATNLLGWWRAEGNTQTMVGTNTGITVGDVAYAPGKVGQAFQFDGAADIVRISNPNPTPTPLGELTVEMWIKRASKTNSTRSGSGTASLFAFGNGANCLGIGNTGGLYFQNGSVSIGGSITDTNWHHVAVTASTGGSITYVDGAVAVASGFPQDFNFAAAAFGGAVNTSNGFFGWIDEPALYGRSLTALEIQAIYNAGTNGRCWLPEPPTIVTHPHDQVIAAGHDTFFTVAATGRPATFHYQWTRNGLDIPGATNSWFEIPEVQLNQAGEYAVKVTNPYGTVASSNAILNVTPAVPCTPLPSDRVAWWHAENNVSDEVGHLPVTTHGLLSFRDGKVGQSFYFDGASTYLQLPATSNLNVATGAGFTLEAWIAPERGGRQGIIGWNDNSSDFGGLGVMLEINDSGPGSLSAFLISAEQGFDFLRTTNDLVRPNIFQHVALTYDRASRQVRLYHNGGIVAQTELSIGFELQTHSDFCLGIGDAFGWLGGLFQGRIDEPTLYRRALDQNEINSIYQSAAAGKCTDDLAILIQPQSQSGLLGDPISMEVVATSLAPINYQWSKGMIPLDNSAHISGVTSNRLTIANLGYGDIGTYSVTVSNEFGLVVSSNVLVAVANPATPLFTSIAVLGDGSVSGTVTGFVSNVALEASTNLVNWNKIATLVLTNGTAAFSDEAATNYSHRFYRIRNE